jgi:hypothetical protein
MSTDFLNIFKDFLKILYTRFPPPYRRQSRGMCKKYPGFFGKTERAALILIT